MYPHKITCVLCPEKIKPNHVLCKECYKQYHQYMNEPWFLEMVKMQRQQDAIDQREIESLPINHQIITYDKTEIGKRVGRPAKESKLVNIILSLFDKNIDNVALHLEKRLSLRQIQHLVKQQGYHVAPNTIKNILRKYRKDTYKRFVQKITSIK